MKALIAYLIVATTFSTAFGQVNHWMTVHTGFPNHTGNSELIVKNKCIYVFNGTHGVVMRSKTGGLTWDQVKLPCESPYHEFNDVFFLNDSVGFVAGYEGSLFMEGGIHSVVKKTTDRGDTWQTLSNGLSDDVILTNINFINEKQGIVFGTAAMRTHRFITYDGGQTWSRYYNEFNGFPDLDAHQVNYSSFSGEQGVASGIGHYFHFAVTFDGGETWQTRHHHNAISPSGLYFIDGANGVITVEDSLFITDDAARTFTAKRKFPYSNFIKAFDMIDMKKGYFCNESEIYYTPDAGETWQLSYSNPELHIMSLKVAGKQVYVTTAENNFILKGDSVTDVSEEELQSRIGSQHVRIVPNPASDEIFVKVPDRGQLANIAIVDQTGRLVRSRTGSGQESVIVRDLAPGLYVVVVEVSGVTYRSKIVVAR